MHYNLAIGTISPILWIINIILIVNTLAQTKKCSHHASLCTLLGHLLSALLIYITVAAAGLVFWRNIRV